MYRNFFKRFKNQFPEYLFKDSKNLLALAKQIIIQELIITFPSSLVNIFFFQQFSFLLTFIEWNKPDLKIKNSEVLCASKKSIWELTRLSSNFILNCHSPNGIKINTRLKLGLNHFCKHKFRQNFQKNLKPFFKCGKTSRLPCITYFFVQTI